jgi:hypothetical protein
MFFIISFCIYAALVPTEQASFTPQSIIDSQAPYLGEETSQDTIEICRHKSFSTNMLCVISDFVSGPFLLTPPWTLCLYRKRLKQQLPDNLELVLLDVGQIMWFIHPRVVAVYII